MTYRVNDFFCGSGGMGLGFKQAGVRLGGAWDFDKHAVESYGHNVSPKVKKMDIREMTIEDVPPADIWTFGFPCQDISVAGKQAGMIKDKTRSGLFYEIMRLLGEETHRPKIILAENVKMVKKYLPEIEKEYKKAGYTMKSAIYDSKFWNVPQNRQRYFIIGVREDIKKDYIFPAEQTEFTPKLSTILESNVDEKFYIDNEKAQKIIEQATQRVELKSVHPCITPDRVTKRQNGRRAKEEEAPMFTITAQDMHGVIIEEVAEQVKEEAKKRRPNDEIDVKIFENGNIRPHKMDARKSGLSEINTITYEDNTAPSCIASHVNSVYGTKTKYRVRKLTPREYARLQGFPDSYEQVVSNTQFYKQMGNAVTVPVAKAIAESIKTFLDEI